jgi:hypothetical protein
MKELHHRILVDAIGRFFKEVVDDAGRERGREG